MPYSSSKYTCENCDFKCSKHSNYMIHLNTTKHKNLENQQIKCQIMPQQYECECGKLYKERTGLWRHKQKCNSKNNEGNVNNVEYETQSSSDIHEVIGLLVKENQDFKKLLIEQSSQMMELAKNSQIVNNNNTTNNNNNNQFNLNFFLNDTCKDAMNITEFIGNLNVQIDELEYIGNHGYVNGMTKMIMDRLRRMDITKRPIHCTDIKRETMYIKNKDEWSKDTEELSLLRKVLGRISMNNYRIVPEWKIAHPDCEEPDTRDYNFCYNMMRVILGDVEDEQIKLDNKIIKTMAKGLFCK